MEKLDLTRKYKTYYTAKTKSEFVEIEPAHYISITGKGDPSAKEYADKLQALYATAYAIKFMCKALNNDFVVAKLEGLWKFDEVKYGGLSMREAPVKVPRTEWEYRMLIRMPEFVTEKQVRDAMEKVVSQKQITLAKEIEYFTMAEGKCVQQLHVGAFDREPETLQQMQEFMAPYNLVRNGLHHEIYLSDFNRTAPEKLKTILREPVKDA